MSKTYSREKFVTPKYHTSCQILYQNNALNVLTNTFDAKFSAQIFDINQFITAKKNRIDNKINISQLNQRYPSQIS